MQRYTVYLYLETALEAAKAVGAPDDERYAARNMLSL
jgi:hypothetical protein